MKIFEVYTDTKLYYCTRSESKAYESALKAPKYPVWITEVELDTLPAKERVWDKLMDFRKEHGL